MVFRYVPVIRPKRGERVGIHRISSGGRQDVVPLFRLTPDRYVGKKATKSHAAIPPPAFVVQELLNIWGTQPFFIDTSLVPHAGPLSQHPLIRIANSARGHGMQLIPATRRVANPQYQQAVAAVINADNRGVGLQVDLSEMTSAASWAAAWPYSVNQTDLMVDLSGNVGNVAALGQATIDAFSLLHQGGNWASVTVIGTSMPDNFQGWASGLYLIPRAEWSLWQALSNAHLPYRLDYGDYTTVPVNPAPSGIKWGYPINVKYTLESEFLICRGVTTTRVGAVNMKQQLRRHARDIVQHPNRRALVCWADGNIDAIAANTADPSGLEHWVQLGVNRHIERVRASLP